MRQNIIFLLFLFFYLSLSLILLVFTSGGWAALGIMIYGFVFSVALFILAVIMSIIFRKRTVNPSLKIFLVVLFLLTLSILFNTGDGGDGPGSYIFIDSFLGAISPDLVLFGNDSGYPGFSGIFMFTYIFSLVIFVNNAFLKGTIRDSAEQQPQSNLINNNYSENTVS